MTNSKNTLYLIVVLITSLLTSLTLVSNLALGQMSPNPSQKNLTISEIEVPGKIKVLLPSNTTMNVPQIVNTSFVYQGKEAYFALRLYLPGHGNICDGGGSGGGGIPPQNLKDVKPDKATSSIIQNTTITGNGTGFTQAVILPQNPGIIVCAHGGWR